MNLRIKKTSGSHIGVYKYPRALYTDLTHSLIYLVAVLNIEESMKRISEILNALEKMVDDLYEVGNDDAQYFEEMIGEAMDIILESDQ